MPLSSGVKCPNHRMFTVINFIISISKTFLSHVQDYADELLTPLTILDESGTALPNAQVQFKVMLKGPSSLKSYLGLPFNVLQVSRRALNAYSPIIFYNYWSYPLYSWSYPLYSFYDLQMRQFSYRRS